MLPEPKISSVFPEGWTGDMFHNNWHDTLKTAKENIILSLDKYHREETEWLNNKLQHLNN